MIRNRRRKLTDNKLKVLMSIQKHPNVSRAEITRISGIDFTTVSKSVNELKTRGLVGFKGNRVYITGAGTAIIADIAQQQAQKIRNYSSSWKALGEA